MFGVLVHGLIVMGHDLFITYPPGALYDTLPIWTTFKNKTHELWPF